MRAVTSRDENARRVLAHVAAHPVGLTAYDIARALGWVTSTARPDASRSRAALAVLEAAGQVRRESHDGRIAWYPARTRDNQT